ncbi:Ig-like domain-containing protein [Luteolibacter flavescens]|uniref:Ig-like domain-containing protein n=1 Tax=Luteolibacter flavescens TaxID=1859460 RepID=A0ABT3FIJ2_9BACT|nr:Ig-like domain-containing protein [Luteolibacter flavescens]MCW1883267.1 Ig-like domain-containing protein [Luteolibacter flavescens]
MAITRLPNGHHVVIDPLYDAPGAITDAGAVHHYDASWTRLATLRGSRPYDHVGSGGVTILADGSYAVHSPNWDRDAIADAGAITWCPASTGVNGVVSATNSLTGRAAGDLLGESRLTFLSDGSMIVRCSGWDSPPLVDVGAVAWFTASSRPIGILQETSSIIGSSDNDRIGSDDVLPLSGGRFLIRSSTWNNGPISDAGSITWCPGGTPLSGVVSATNSMVGSYANEALGSSSITVLANGNLVIANPSWTNGSVANAGAVRWCEGSTASTGPITAANSLVGTTSGDRIGSAGIIAIPNGHFIVASPEWNLSSSVSDVGAVTWVNGTSGIAGAVSAANSLVGSRALDQVGSTGVKLLPCPGNVWNYVVTSPYWGPSSSLPNPGAATWCSGSTGLTGPVSAANSLTGATAQCRVGNEGIVVLPQGNFFVVSSTWDSATQTDIGAVTWVNGTTGMTGNVTAQNSLTGSTAGDAIGAGGITVLANGNAVLSSPGWSAGTGAVTWLPSTGATGAISSMNSLIGSATGDRAGSAGITPLPSGHYLVRSPDWQGGAGALTWADGGAGIVGSLSAGNSLVGSSANDRVGDVAVRILADGNYVVSAPYWDRGSIADAGAVMLCPGGTATTGTMDESNALVGSAENDLAGISGITALTNGAYVVNSGRWGSDDRGAVTWGKAGTGVRGTISPGNSLVGASANDGVGSSGTSALPGGRYLVRSGSFDRGAIPDTGAVTIGNAQGSAGVIGPANSLVGPLVSGHLRPFQLSAGRLVTGMPSSNRIILMDPIEQMVTDGDVRALGTVASGSSTTLVLKYQAATGPNFAAPAVTIDGSDAGLFTIIGATAPDSDGVGTVTVAFAPTGSGAKNATLHIGDIDVALTGSGNTPPVFAGASASTFNETPLVLYHAKLFRSTTDPEGDSFTVTMATPSQHGGTVQVRGDSVVYYPPAGFTGTDQFVITLTDARGADSQSTIQVEVGGPLGTGQNQPSISTDTSGGQITQITLTWQVIPLRSYEIERSSNLTDWTPVTVAAANEVGRLRWNDNSPLQGSSYYRLRTP